MIIESGQKILTHNVSLQNNFVEVIWKHGSRSGSGSGHGSGRGSNLQIFLEAEVEAKRHHFHITVPNNQAAATATS